MRAFVTGATGFAGSYLVDNLLAHGIDVVALSHPQTSHQQLPHHPQLASIPGDLLDPATVGAAVASVQPDVIFHLAGQAYPARSWDSPAKTLAVNAGGTANVLQAAVAYGRPRVVVVTSAEVYGRVTTDVLPLTERTPPDPRHPYGVSKLAAGQLALLYWQRYRLPVVEARPFNHIGPRQATGFVVPDFASQLAAIKHNRQNAVISVGNLDVKRDFTDVRDVVQAYRLLAEKGEPGEAYLICRGEPVSIRFLLNTLIELAGVEVQVVHDVQRARAADIPCLYGSYQKIAQHTQWRPHISLRQSLADTLAEWEQRMSLYA
jgi:GDP-4-dehydro-6-deoxy-D-mannose reductase